MSKANTAPPAAAGTITIDATGSETMSFASFVRGGFLEGIAGSGFPNFDNSSGSVGKEMMFSYGTGASDKYVLMQGNIEYSFATHTVAGTGNTIEYGTRGSGDYNSNGAFIGGDVQLRITGLKLHNAVPTTAEEEIDIETNGPIHTFTVAHMYGAPTDDNEADYDVFADSLADYAQIYLGASGRDIYSGSAFGDTISGNGGDDELNGGGGSDVIAGGAGGDKINGGSGRDTASYVDAAAGVVADLSKPGSNSGDAAGDKYKAVENLAGSKFADALTGNASANSLTGGAGKDTLTGGAGRDQLDGGAGRDRFVFDSGDTGATRAKADLILRFDSSDVIDVSGLDADTSIGGDQDFDFIGTDAFSGEAGELRFVKETNATWIEGDVNGDGKADFVIKLDTAISLKANDFDL